MAPPRYRAAKVKKLTAGNNLEEWFASIRLQLQRTVCSYGYFSDIDTFLIFIDNVSESRRIHIYHFITTQITKGFMKMILVNVRGDVIKLMKWLRDGAKRSVFHLMDLPSELREQVYECHFRSRDYGVHRNIFCGRDGINASSAMSNSYLHRDRSERKQCRNQDQNQKKGSSNQTPAARIVDRWVDAGVKDYTRYLRKVQMTSTAPGGEVYVVEFCSMGGLEVDLPHDLCDRPLKARANASFHLHFMPPLLDLDRQLSLIPLQNDSPADQQWLLSEDDLDHGTDKYPLSTTNIRLHNSSNCERYISGVPSSTDDRDTAVCMLREGDYQTWTTNLIPVFKEHRYIDGICDDVEELLRQLNSLHGVAALRARKIITAHVAASVLSRIPTTKCNSIDKLFGSLKIAAQPFRFMDLPPELRDYFYQDYFSNLKHGDDDTVCARHQSWDAPFARPNLLLASPQLNAEATPAYLMCTDFHFGTSEYVANWIRHNDSGRAAPGHHPAVLVQKAIRKWKVEAVQQHAKFLRKVSVITYRRASAKAYAFTFSPVAGLKVQLPTHLTNEKRLYLERRAAESEAERKANGLQGEAMVEILTKWWVSPDEATLPWETDWLLSPDEAKLPRE
ncbi:hypothetical protein LTR15_006218 [Elasticomyces elasticus]|nr:hypothetical protein LTR15_006218 [Elasticomyces elasticus]